MPRIMYVLGIETTCDETAVAIVEDGRVILANEVASQAALHAGYGGVFPELASREHVTQLLPLVTEALKKARLQKAQIDLIAVADRPGLMGSLLIGVTAAETLGLGWNKPVIGVNHVEAHLYSALMVPGREPLFPALGVVLSGGHTFLARMVSATEYTILGTTVDDAIGEAFDKVGKLLALPYPAGPAIERLARRGDPKSYPFQPGRVKGRPLDFSFSGLKTNVFYTVRGNAQRGETFAEEIPTSKKCDLAASFQRAAFDDVLSKVQIAECQNSFRSFCFGGGVTANQTLQTLFSKKGFPLPLYWPEHSLTGDNGAMIAGLGFHLFRENKRRRPIPMPRLPLVAETATGGNPSETCL